VSEITHSARDVMMMALNANARETPSKFET
jgi:hypothetical protein